MERLIAGCEMSSNSEALEAEPPLMTARKISN
jgi:hypothetical protein